MVEEAKATNENIKKYFDNAELLLIDDTDKTDKMVNTEANGEKCSGKNCDGYRGRQTKTVSGRTCQAWNTDIPHIVDRCCTPANHRTAGLDGNYCRNPSSDSATTIWCYTTDPLVEWEYCKPIDPLDLA